jgi:predicted ATPase
VRNLDVLLQQAERSIQTRREWTENYPNFIYRIRFPVYKNLAPNTILEFKYPLTVLTGQNGCGKSSILHALQGAPSNRSVGNFWFSTKLDPIQEARGKPNCFIFQYYNEKAKKKVEVIKLRVKFDKLIGGTRRVNPDYWEPKRAAKEYQMTPPRITKGRAEPGGLASGRWEVPKIPVQYIDFRAELSAFDQYFYFGEKPFKSKRYKTKQDRLRAWVRNRLSPLFKGDSAAVYNRGRKKLNKTAVKPLPEDQVRIISYILGKTYTRCRMVEHECFGSEGYSVQFQIDSGATYTEAFSGSGEMAVVRVVHSVFETPPGSLIILDEPEVSLHPGAQKKLRDFLLSKCIELGHQVVLASHSPAFVEGLPEKAIRVLVPGTDGGFRVSGDVNVNDAFVQIGHTIQSKCQIVVEDSAAKNLVSRALQILGNEFVEFFQVDYYPGGESSIFKDLIVHARRNDPNIYVIFDGDIYSGEWPDCNSISDQELDRTIEKHCKHTVRQLNFRFDGGNDASITSKRIQIKREFLQYCSERCHYLPADTPEEVIWSAARLDEKEEIEQLASVTGKDKFKEFIGVYSKEQTDNDTSLARNVFIQQLLKRNCDPEHPHFDSLLNTLRQIKAHAQRSGLGPTYGSHTAGSDPRNQLIFSEFVTK